MKLIKSLVFISAIVTGLDLLAIWNPLVFILAVTSVSARYQNPLVLKVNDENNQITILNSGSGLSNQDPRSCSYYDVSPVPEDSNRVFRYFRATCLDPDITPHLVCMAMNVSVNNDGSITEMVADRCSAETRDRGVTSCSRLFGWCDKTIDIREAFCQKWQSVAISSNTNITQINCEVPSELKSSCFPLELNVKVAHEGTTVTKKMGELKKGDLVWSDVDKEGKKVFDEVEMISHYEPSTRSSYIMIITHSGAKIIATPKHFISVFSAMGEEAALHFNKVNQAHFLKTENQTELVKEVALLSPEEAERQGYTGIINLVLPNMKLMVGTGDGAYAQVHATEGVHWPQTTRALQKFRGLFGETRRDPTPTEIWVQDYILHLEKIVSQSLEAAGVISSL